MKRRTFLIVVACLALASCDGLRVFVTNTPDRPVPTAPMGVETDPQGQMVARYNPQLGDAPTLDAYQDAGFSLAGLFAALPGPWGELASMVMLALGIGGPAIGYSKHREAKRADARAEEHKADAEEGWTKAMDAARGKSDAT